MCYVCSCFGWVLDFIQRVVTFLLACWMSCAVLFGLLVAIVAGIAYGYNYSMAEFLTFTRSDVTVYMRRGQFYDQPDVRPRGFRRSGDEEDAFPEPVPNENADYEMKNPQEGGSPLQDSWQAHDTRRYAEKLIKYNPVFRAPVKDADYRAQAVQADEASGPQPDPDVKVMTPTPLDYYKLTSSPFPRATKVISITPNRLVSTAVWQSGSSKIIMRNFHMSTMPYADALDDDEQEYDARVVKLNPLRTRNLAEVPTNTPVAVFGPADVTRSSYELPMRHWEPTTPVFQDYSEEVDEDNVVYKPV